MRSATHYKPACCLIISLRLSLLSVNRTACLICQSWNYVTIKTDQPTEDLTLDNFCSDETAMARDLAQRIHRIQSGQIDSATQPPPASTKTKSATHSMTFNPLHPSMELPPEQLIRLRNMHVKQISKEARKGSAKRHHSTSKQTAKTEPAQFSRIEEEYSEDNNHQTKKWLLTGGFHLHLPLSMHGHHNFYCLCWCTALWFTFCLLCYIPPRATTTMTCFATS